MEKNSSSFFLVVFCGWQRYIQRSCYDIYTRIWITLLGKAVRLLLKRSSYSCQIQWANYCQPPTIDSAQESECLICNLCLGAISHRFTHTHTLLDAIFDLHLDYSWQSWTISRPNATTFDLFLCIFLHIGNEMRKLSNGVDLILNECYTYVFMSYYPANSETSDAVWAATANGYRMRMYRKQYI